MRKDGGQLGPSETLPQLRTCGLLRFLEEQARHQTLPPGQASADSFHRGRRELGLVLRRPGNRRRNRISASSTRRELGTIAGTVNMVLVPGTVLGPYEILSPLGAGGMGEVYRARDGRLGRDVAIKAMSPAFAGDADRVARFQREAHILAALNHPNIAAIYGLEEFGGERFLVLEYVP